MAGQAIALKDTSRRTKVENVLECKGNLLVKVFHDVGTLNARYNTAIEVSTLRLFDPGNPDGPTDGIRVELKEEEDFSHSAFMDVDEVEALVGGLEYMTNLAGQCQGYTGDYTEVIFSTKGDVQVGFYVKDGKVKAFLKVETGTAYLPVSALQQVADLLRHGQRHLQSASTFFDF